MNDFRPTFAQVHSRELLEMAPLERELARRPLRPGQVQHLLCHEAFRAFVAKVKEEALETQNRFFAGIGVPKGLEQASAREAYFAALVNNARSVIDLQRKLWEEALAAEPAEAPAPKERATEEDPFGTMVVAPVEEKT